ncbi:hypothetical protein ACOMHN_047027 [Nucella lapillus]
MDARARYSEEDGICAFCGNGTKVEQDCGKLHCHKGVLFAHHKCMQYSSGLTQYTFEHFGGFDVTEVQNEIKRGKKLVCSWCRKVKLKGGLPTSATAGCMLGQCHKSFHFLCARLHTITSRRRLRTEKGEVDLYRTFCSRKHKKKYQRSDDAKYEYSCCETDEEQNGVPYARRSNKGMESESDSSDDDSTTTVKQSLEQQSDEDTEIEDNAGRQAATVCRRSQNREVASVCRASVNTNQEIACKRSMSLKKEWLSSEIPRGTMDCVVILTSLECTAFTQGKLQLQESGSYKIMKTETNLSHGRRGFKTSKKKVLWKSSPESCTESHSLKLKLRKEATGEVYSRCSTTTTTTTSRKTVQKKTRMTTRSKRKLSDSDTESDPNWKMPVTRGKRTKSRYAEMTSPESSGAMFTSDSSDFDLPISFPELNQKIRRTSKKAFSTYRRIQTPRMSSTDSELSSDRKGSSPEMSKQAAIASAVGLQPLENPVPLPGMQLPSDRIMEQMRSVAGLSTEANNMIDSSDLEELHLPAFAAAFGKPKKNTSQDAAALGYSNPLTTNKNTSQQGEHRETGNSPHPYSHDGAREEKESRKRRHEDVTESKRGMPRFQNSCAENMNNGFHYYPDEFQTGDTKKDHSALPLPYVDRPQPGDLNPSELAEGGQEKDYYEGDGGQDDDSPGLKDQPDTSQPPGQWSTVNEIPVDDSANLLTVQSMSEDLIKKNEAIGRQLRLTEEESTASECVLVIPADAKRFENVAFDVQNKVAEELGFEEKHIYIWTAVTPILLPASCMLLYFRDLVSALQNQDWTWLRQLLTDSDTLKMKHDMEYAPKTRRHKNLVNSVQKEQEITKLVESVVQGLNAACDQSGDFVGMFTTSHGVNYLFLIINHFSDQHQLLRKALHQRLAMYQWREADLPFSSFEGIPAKRLQGHHLQESFILRKWFTTNFQQISKAILLPEEELLLSSDPTCSTDSNCFAQLKCRMEECEVSSAQVYKSDLPLVIFIRKIDRNIVCFERYLQACLKKYSKDFENRRVTCIFHVDNLSLKKCPRLDLGGADCSIKLYTAFSPFERPISLVIADVVRDWI